MAKKFALRYVELANDGRPPEMKTNFSPISAHEGSEPRDFQFYFHSWSRARIVYPDPYVKRLEGNGRSEMFGRAVDTVYQDTSRHKDFHFEGAISQQWRDEIDCGLASVNDHKQSPLRLEGVTVIATSLHVDVRKHSRCRELIDLLQRTKIEFVVVDLAEPQYKLARLQAAQKLKQQSKSEFDLLSLPLLFRDEELILVGDERSEIGWQRLQRVSENELREMLGLGLVATVGRHARSVAQRAAKIFGGGTKTQTLEEVQKQSTVAGRSGYLEKEGGFMKNHWERRFFVLTDAGVLYWFKEARPKDAAQG